MFCLGNLLFECISRHLCIFLRSLETRECIHTGNLNRDITYIGHDALSSICRGLDTCDITDVFDHRYSICGVWLSRYGDSLPLQAPRPFLCSKRHNFNTALDQGSHDCIIIPFERYPLLFRIRHTIKRSSISAQKTF